MLTEAEIKTDLITTYGASEFAATIESLWGPWFLEASASENRDLILRVKVLTFLQGQMWRRYNVTTGKDKRETFQQWEAITKMLETAQKTLDGAGGATGAVTHVVTTTSLNPRPMVKARTCEPRHGKGYR